MKKLLIAILLLIGLTGYGQTNRFPSIDSAKAYVLKFIKTSAVEAFTNYRLQNVQYGTLELIDSLISAGAGAVDSIWLSAGFATDTLKYSIGGNTRTIGILDRHEGVQSGCRVTYSGVGLIFDVSSGVYYINGTRYTTLGGQVTLDPAHATLDRKDVIGLNSSGPIKITGTAASSPAIPQFGIDTIGLTVVDINAGATVPSGISTTTIYNENTEWTGSASGVTVNFNNTLNVFTGTKAADVGAFTNGQSITFTNGSTVSAADYSDLKFYINLKAAFANNVSLQLTFLNGSTVVSNTVNVTNGTFGFSRTTTGSYQKITIPLSSWNFTNSNFNKLRITFSNGNTSGCYLDYINLQQGITQTIITNSNPCLTCFSSTTQLNDSTFTLNRVNGTRDTIIISGIGGGGTIDTLWALNSSTIYPKLRRNILIGDSGLVAESPLHHISTNSTVTSQIWQPSNYGQNFYSPTYPYGGRAKRFSNGWAVFDVFNPDGRQNVVWYHGYNAAPAGGVIDTGDAGFQFREETHYYNFARPEFEFHLPETYSRDRKWHRLFSIYSGKADGVSRIESAVNSHTWIDTTGNGYALIRVDPSDRSAYFNLTAQDSSHQQQITLTNVDASVSGLAPFQITNSSFQTSITKTYPAALQSEYNAIIFGVKNLDLTFPDDATGGRKVRIHHSVPLVSQGSALFSDTTLINQYLPGTIPEASAQLELRSTTKGFLNSRMTGTQMAAISSPATGLLIYNTDSLAFCFYNGTSWVKLAAATGGGGGGSQTPWTSNINAAGFTLFGNSTSGGTLTLGSTSNVTKGKILFGASGYDEVNDRLGVGNSTPAYTIDAAGTIYSSGTSGIAFGIANNTSLRSIGTASNMYIDAGSDLNGNITMRGNTLNLTDLTTINIPSFTVSGDITVSGGSNRFITINSTGTPGLRINNTGTKNWAIENTRTAAAGSLEFTNLTDDPSNPKLTILSGGNVGITNFAPTSRLQTQSFATAVAAKTTTYTADITDYTITGDATSAAFTITLPTAVGITGRIYVIKKIDSSGNAVTVGTTSSQNIDASTTYSLATQYKYVTVQSNGANWIIIGNN